MRLASHFIIFRRASYLAVGILIALSLSRLMLIGIHWDRAAPTDGLGFMLLQGIRFDIILLGIMFGPVFVFKPWFHTFSVLRQIGKWGFSIYLAIFISLSFFVEACTLSFIAEYDSRPNFQFVEYLAYPREVFSMLVGSHLLELIIVSSFTLLICIRVFVGLYKDPNSDNPVPFWFPFVVMPLAAILMLAMIRSTLTHRPVNPSNAVFSQDSMINQLPLNSPYALMYAIYEHRREASAKAIRYGSMDENEALAIVLKEAGISSADQIDPSTPTLHHQTATLPREKPLNLVIILEESLGADTVGSLGGMDITPELDKLANEGIWFERLYATGTRSVRGIEAIISGFTPTPMVSVVKLSETQSNFFTLASLLKKHHYETSFIYGGEAHFDNMKRFLLNNGFQTVIDQQDYLNPVYQSTWGVSDEDMFNRAHEELNKTGELPFFKLIFTSSNHEPFGIPQNRVSPEEDPEGDRKTAIRYADYALGQFLEKARNSHYWENTVFLIVADHPARLFAGKLVPVHRFHIPAVIIGDTIEARRIPGISSQIDFIPTLLSLLGINSAHPGIGRDLTLPEYQQGSGRAMMQFNALQAYLEDDRVVILQPDLDPLTFRLESNGEMLQETDVDTELERRALAYSLWGPMMINLRAYHE